MIPIRPSVEVRYCVIDIGQIYSAIFIYVIVFFASGRFDNLKFWFSIDMENPTGHKDKWLSYQPTRETVKRCLIFIRRKQSVCLSLSLSSRWVRKRKRETRPGGEGTVDVIQSRLEREREREREKDLSCAAADRSGSPGKEKKKKRTDWGVCSTSLLRSYNHYIETDVIMHAVQSR